MTRRTLFDNLLTPFGPNGPNVPPPSSVEEISRVAAGIRFPDDLAHRKKADSEASLKRSKADLAANPNLPLPQIIETEKGTTRAYTCTVTRNLSLPQIIEAEKGKTRTYTREETIAAMEREPHDPPLGEWPESPDPSVGLSVAYNLTGEPLPSRANGGLDDHSGLSPLGRLEWLSGSRISCSRDADLARPLRRRAHRHGASIRSTCGWPPSPQLGRR